MKLHNYITALLGITLIALSLPYSASAQYHKERGLVRNGNEQFEKRNYRRSLENYESALEYDSTNYEAMYNRANAYHHAMYANPKDTTYKASELNANYDKILADTLLSDRQRAEIYRNYGESLFAEENYEAALNSFRESLKLNPNDQETKYNYVLTKRIVDQKRQSEQNQGGDNSDNNQDQQQNQNQQQNQSSGGGNDNQQEQQQNNDDNKSNEDKNQDNRDDNKGDNNKDNNNSNEQKDNNDNSDEQKDNNDQNNGNGKENHQNDQDNQNDQNNQNNNGKNGENGESDAQPEPKELSPEQQRMLDAMQAEEDKTQEKLKEQKRGVIIPGKKNW